MDEIIYAVEKSLDPDEFIEVLKSSTLADRRPVNDEQRIIAMCNNANLIVTARLNGLLIGVARSMTDFFIALIFPIWLLMLITREQESGKNLLRKLKKLHHKQSLFFFQHLTQLIFIPK